MLEVIGYLVVMGVFWLIVFVNIIWGRIVILGWVINCEYCSDSFMEWEE